MSLFHLQIVTADGLFYDGEAERILLRSIGGDVCIMANHMNYVTALGKGTCRVTDGEGSIRSADCSGGMLSVQNNEVRIVASTFGWAE